MDKPRGVLVIDLYGLTADEVRSRYPAIYQWVLERVKPERDNNNRESRKRNWWLFGETNPKLRRQLDGLPRYIATVETAKHRVFQFLDADILPDNKLINIALADAFHLGILSSRVHITWAMATGSTLEDRPVYPKSRCFETFPFPDLRSPDEAQRNPGTSDPDSAKAPSRLHERIAHLAEQIDTHRKRVLLPSPSGRGAGG